MSIIMITRGSLSTSFKLKDKLSELLNYRAVAREEVIKHALKYGIEETGLAGKGVVETQPPYFWDRHTAQRRHYLTIFKAALMDFVVDGNAIYHGHLGQFLLSDIPILLRVRADASMEYRVHMLMRESGRTERDASDYINQIDCRRAKWARFLYGTDFNNPANFDLVLNMDKMSIETMADIVVRTTERPEFKVDELSLKVIKDAHLRAVVLAHLVRSPRTRGMDLSVECDTEKGHVKIQGIAPALGTDVWEKDIKEVLSSVEGISKLEVVSKM